MYNIANHYENIYQYLKTIITDPRVLYLHPFGATTPDAVEILRNDLDPPKRRGPLFIFYDQEPLNFIYNKPLFDYITANLRGPYILVHTEHYSEELTKICKHYKFASLDYFFHIFAAADWYRGHEYLPGIVEPKSRNITKSYITFNRLTSNERVYRSLFINELYKSNILECGHVSFSKECPDGGKFDVNLLKGVDNQNIDPALANQAIANISKLPELRIDFADQDIPNQSMLLSPLPQLMESLIFVVTETCYWQNKTHLTEKIFKPIVLRMPFVLVGCVNNLEYLRSYGFKTFGDYWDESYDSVIDPIVRMQRIAKILLDISNLTNTEQKSMLLDMQPILDHNYQLFNNPGFIKQEWQNLTGSLDNIVKYYKYQPPYTIDLDTGQAIPLHPSVPDSKVSREQNIIEC
jgi:hypothetical protein